MNYHNKRFRPVTNTPNGEVSEDLVCEYQQEGYIVTCQYQGSRIVMGQLIGLVDEEGNIDMRYHQVNAQGRLMTGICFHLPNGWEMVKSGYMKIGYGPPVINLREAPLWKNFKATTKALSQ